MLTSKISYFQISILIIILIFMTNFFQSTPIEALFFQLQAGFLGLVLLFFIVYVMDLISRRESIDKVVLYFMSLIVFMPFYSAFISNIAFGQPYFYGILSQRGWLLLEVGVWFYYMLITKKMTIQMVEKSFLFMTFISLVVFTLFVLFFDPSQLSERSEFAHMTEDRGVRFKFQYFFITFGTLYFFIKYSIYKNSKDLFILLIFLAFTLFIIKGRTYMIYLAIVFFLYYYFNYSFSKFTLTIIKAIFFILASLVALQIFMPEYLEKMSTLFMEMFRVLGGEESNDMSANARIWTTKIVLDYFDAHPLSIFFGSGRISHQWNGGYETLFGYFYPSDIGLLGGLFIYGVFGITLLAIIPIYLELKEIKRCKENSNVFIITVKYMLILSIVKLMQGGGIYFGANVWIVLFFTLYAYNRLEGRKYV